MLKYRFHILFIISIIPLSNYSQDFLWARQFDGYENETSKKIEIDNNGNSYIFGTSGSELFDIDPTNGVEMIDNTSNNNVTSLKGLFLTKLDSDGNYIWGLTFNTFSYYDEAIDIKISSDNYIYILYKTKYYEQSFNQEVQGFGIKKISFSGQVLLTKNLTNLASPSTYNVFNASSFDLDSQNNIYICGFFHSRLKLHPTDPNLDLISGRDSFLIKLNSVGDLIWAKKFNINTSNEHFEDIDVSNDGNINVLLSRGDNIYTTPPTQMGMNILKINSVNGNIIWQKELFDQIPIAFHKNNNDEIIIIGRNIKPGPVWNSLGYIDVDPSTNINQIQSQLYALWLDSNGNYVDVKPYSYQLLPGNVIINFNDVTTDTNNNTYLFGYFKNSFDADTSQNIFLLNHTCSFTSLTREGFCIKLDSNRDFENAFKFGSTGNCSNLWIEDLKIKDNVYFFVGNFTHDIDLDPTNDGFFFNSTNNTYSDAYILKLGNCDTSIPQGNQNQTFCSNQNPTISDLSPNSSTIRWYNSPTSTNQLSSTQNLINGQTYYASRQLSNCPESIDRLAVTVHISQSPPMPISSNQTFCENENAIISDLVATGQNLKWYDSLTGGNILVASTMLQNNTTYYVSQTINNCESIRASVYITITPNQSPISNSQQQFCIQQNATLTDIAITGQNIKWYDSPTAGNLLTNTTLLQNGTTYYASQTINSCESTRVPVTVTIQNTPAPTGSTAQSFCSSQNATLNDITISGTNIIWYSSLIGNTVLPATTLVANNTTYYATQTVNNCESPTRFSITTTLINTLNANNHSETICDDLNNGSETVNLSNYNTDLIAPTSGAVFSYYHSQNGAENQIGSDQITNYSNFNLSVGNHLIFVRIDSANGCHQIVELNLTLASKPSIPITDIMPICEGSDITVSAGTGFDSYLWSTAETSSSITITAPGNYSVTVTENHGSINCSSVKNFTVVNSNAATISNIVTTDWTSNQNTISVLLTSNSTGNYLYSIDGVHYQTSNTFTNLPHGEYTVFVKDDNGCGIRTEDVYLLMYPNFFTPNGDGFNDYWKIEFSEYEPNLNVQIFDRYGKLLKELGANSQGWNGTYLGNPVPSSDYWFVVKRQNGKEYRGHFSLKR